MHSLRLIFGLGNFRLRWRTGITALPIWLVIRVKSLVRFSADACLVLWVVDGVVRALSLNVWHAVIFIVTLKTSLAHAFFFLVVKDLRHVVIAVAFAIPEPSAGVFAGLNLFLRALLRNFDTLAGEGDHDSDE